MFFEEIMAEHLLTLGKDIDIQVQESQRDKVNPKRNILRCIIIRILQVKDKENI